MRKVLIISYRFPPQLSTRSVQVARWVKFLPRHGWEPVVVCADERSVYNTDIDFSLNNLIPPNIKVEKVKSCEPKVVMALAARVAPFMMRLPDVAIGWYRAACQKALTILREEHFDLILSCAYARTSNLVGLRLKQATALPWVAYFSDPWVESLDKRFDPITEHINRRMERAVVAAADAAVFASQGMREIIMKKYSSGWFERSYVIPQCFDPEVIASVRNNSEGEEETKFTLTFTGNLYGKFRNLEPLLKAMDNISKRHPDLYRHLQLKIVGKLMDYHRELIRQLTKPDVVFMVGSVSYFKSLAYMAEANVLLSLDSPNRWSAMLHPSKIAEYLGFGKPILAITPLDAGWVPIINKIGGIVVSPEDVDGIEQAIVVMYQDFQKGNKGKYNYTDKDVSEYNAINTVRELARTLDGVVHRMKFRK